MSLFGLRFGRMLRREVGGAGRKLSAVVGDISAEGLFVRLERGSLPALMIDSWVDVETSFEGERTLLFGVVRSQHAGGCRSDSRS